jgi:hypothetical protein
MLDDLRKLIDATLETRNMQLEPIPTRYTTFAIL